MPSSIYIDDVFIYGDSLEEVLHYTTLALTRLAEAGFMINLRKSHIGVTKGTVLGHLWASKGYFSPIPGKLEAILEFNELFFSCAFQHAFKCVKWTPNG